MTTTKTCPPIPMITEILDEVLITLAGHYKTTTDEVTKAYLLDIGSVRDRVATLYGSVLLLAGREAVHKAKVAESLETCPEGRA